MFHGYFNRFGEQVAVVMYVERDGRKAMVGHLVLRKDEYRDFLRTWLQVGYEMSPKECEPRREGTWRG